MCIRDRFRIVLGKFGKHGNRLGRTSHVGENQSLEESSLGILRFAGNGGIDLFESLRQLTLLLQTLCIEQVVGPDNGRCAAQRLSLIHI